MKILIAISSFLIVACMTNNEHKPMEKLPYFEINKEEVKKTSTVVYIDEDQFYTY